MVTDAQVRVMRQKRMEGKTQESAAAAGGMTQALRGDALLAKLRSEDQVK